METERVREFHYHTGDAVMIDDVISTGFVTESGDECFGRVVEIIQPRTPVARDHYCEEDGGILIEVDWDGRKGMVLMRPPDGSQWEDLDLIRRAH